MSATTTVPPIDVPVVRGPSSSLLRRLRVRRPDGPFAETDFVKFWTANAVSHLGTQVTLVALPLVAIVFLKASPFEVGLLATFQSLPFLLFGLPAGVAVDRFSRRTILVVSDIGRAAVLLSIPAAYVIGRLTLEQLYVVGFAKGALTVFFEVAYSAYLPALVPSERLLEGNARLEISRSGAQVTGPSVATQLVRIAEAPLAIVADALSFIGSAVFLLSLPRADRGSSGPSAERVAMRTQIAEGIRYVRDQELLLPIAVTTAAWNLFLSMSGAVRMLFLVGELGLDVGALGLVLGIGNAGFVLGALAATRIPRWLGLGRTIWLAAATFGLPLVIVLLAPKGPAAIPTLIASGVVGSFGSVVYSTNQVALRQAITPAHLQGRMTATMKFAILGVGPIGAILGGVLGGSIGLRPTMWIAGIAASLVFIPLLRSPLRTLEAVPVVAEA